MLSFFLRRLLVAIPTLVLISLFVFMLQQLLPGDPVLAMAGEDRDPETLARLRQSLGLDQPLIVQYWVWISGILQGDFGTSVRTGESISTLIAQKLPVTLQLAVMSLAFAILIGIPMGIISAVKKGTKLDLAANVVALSGLSIPNFWLGIMLIMLVSVRWKLLPASGYLPPSEDLWQSIRTMLMPAFVLGTGLAAALMRHSRSAMLEVMRQDYIRTARAKGLYEGRVVLRHGFRNALTPIVTLLGLLFGELIAGAVLTEQIFSIPGFGKLIVDAVFNRDYAVVQGVVLVTAFGFIMINLLADMAYMLLNPKLRAS
ncbi:MAG: ABC transporter permease [Loktanella sp.]|nr:ABC transporter permease [Loktanella sp.]